MFRSLRFAFALLLVPLCSCGLIFQGTTEEISVMSEPSGATVVDNGGNTRVTPFTMIVKRNEDLQFHFSKSGYQSQDISDDVQVEGGYLAADFLFIIPIGWAIDAATGGYQQHQQSVVVAHLDPLPAPAAVAPQKTPDVPTAMQNENPEK